MSYKVRVKTGDRRGSGTDANVYIILYSQEGQCTAATALDCFFRNDFEAGQTDEFKISSTNRLSSVDVLELWRDNSGLFSDWYVDFVEITDTGTGVTSCFPLYKWIKAGFHYKIPNWDTSLPQHEPFPEQRRQLLLEKREQYELEVKAPGLPAQVKTMPDDESFSFDYKWDIVKTKAWLILQSKIVMLTSGSWDSLADLKNVYTKDIFCEPSGAHCLTDDLAFARQRIASLNHSCIELCTHVPDKLGVSEEILTPFLEGLTLRQALVAKRLFVVDHHILEGVPCREGFTLCAPIALFFLDGKQQLRPIAIQLFQEKAKDNPVFLPTDPANVWLLAKMWFNNADASVHQSLVHLGFTHLLMEGVTVVTHRNLSQSHPVFKLLAPHFLYLIAINTRALQALISPEGWINGTMSTGVKGMFEIIRRGIGQWRMNVEGTLPEDLKKRGVEDPGVLPGYHFRDDAILLYNAINKYVTKYVNLYYAEEDDIAGDTELQAWGQELVTARELGGLGLLGVPGNGKFSKREELTLTLTTIIYTCSVAHASANFPQYEEYGFPPNYPSQMAGRPPRDKTELPESAVLKSLPEKRTTLDILVVTKILSSKGTNSLGDFEVQYIVEPEARKIVEEFRADLAEISKTIKTRNTTRDPPYPYLDPDAVPNAISI